MGRQQDGSNEALGAMKSFRDFRRNKISTITTAIAPYLKYVKRSLKLSIVFVIGLMGLTSLFVALLFISRAFTSVSNFFRAWAILCAPTSGSSIQSFSFRRGCAILGFLYIIALGFASMGECTAVFPMVTPLIRPSHLTKRTWYSGRGISIRFEVVWMWGLFWPGVDSLVVAI